MHITVVFDPTNEVSAVRALLDRLDPAAHGAAVTPPQSVTPHVAVEERPAAASDEPVAEVAASPTAAAEAADAATLHQETNPHNLSRRLLEVLTTEGQTFEEMSPAMPLKDGERLTNPQMRAVYRNLKRSEGRLHDEDRISNTVVRTDFDNYDDDGGGRYFLTPAAYAEISRLVGR